MLVGLGLPSYWVDKGFANAKPLMTDLSHWYPTQDEPTLNRFNTHQTPFRILYHYAANPEHVCSHITLNPNCQRQNSYPTGLPAVCTLQLRIPFLLTHSYIPVISESRAVGCFMVVHNPICSCYVPISMYTLRKIQNKHNGVNPLKNNNLSKQSASIGGSLVSLHYP
ncbi:hypothetical protein K470DRAFT_131657 [Piedraia hortae CBS 480.64]|uniref:Uncharacterized protein n=1 Tax=Piedraia hortae CBS 480.64 TaxID=1314780 RepID=A0A6A7BUU4_9PEZI|nr:hypothetical protein K470DRAFT_131657 [Piedraia hortae CBS 480.64]